MDLLTKLGYSIRTTHERSPELVYVEPVSLSRVTGVRVDKSESEDYYDHVYMTDSELFIPVEEAGEQPVEYFYFKEKNQ